jgi:hypothetical protein
MLLTSTGYDCLGSQQSVVVGFDAVLFDVKVKLSHYRPRQAQGAAGD